MDQEGDSLQQARQDLAVWFLALGHGEGVLILFQAMLKE